MKAIEKTILITAIFSITMFLGGVVFAAVEVGTAYYTKVNIWYENPNRIYSTNFHKGTIIPAGSKVVIDGFNSKEIKFTFVERSLSCTLIHYKKHSRISVDELFDRHFSKADVKADKGAYYSLTKTERKNVQMGNLEVGMSKGAAIMAYGYPPSHRTPDISDNKWTYWYSKLQTMVVFFNGDTISRIEKHGPAW